jgi:hypothetical protein
MKISEASRRVTPTVATRRVMREASKRGRTMSRSMSRPTKRAATRPPDTATAISTPEGV